MQVKDIRDKLYQEYGERLSCNKDGTFFSYYDLKFIYRETLETIISRFSGYFGGPRFDEDCIIAMISTSVFHPGKTGIVITTDGIYFLPWSMLDMASGSYWSHESVYKYIELGIGDINTISGISDVFDYKKMANIMDNMYATITAIRRTSVVKQSDIISSFSFFVQNICSLVNAYVKEETIAYAILDITKVFQKSMEIGAGRDFKADAKLKYLEVVEDITQRLQVFLEENEKCVEKVQHQCNMQDDFYVKTLLLGYICSYMVISSKTSKSKLGKQLFSVIEEVFPKLKLDLPEALKEIINSIDDKEINEYIECMIEATIGLSLEWNIAGEVDVMICCASIIPGVCAFWTHVKNEIIQRFQKKERVVDVAKLYREELINYPENKHHIVYNKKTLCKTLLKMQKEMDKQKIPKFLHTINGASVQMIDFAEKIKKEVRYQWDWWTGETPLLICMYNYLFSAGVVFYGDKIIENYLKGSPEYELIGSLGGAIDINEIKTVSYIKNVVYTDIQLDTENGYYTIPITPLSRKYAPFLCECISQIYQSIGVDIRVSKPMSYKEEYAEKCNEIYRKYYKIKEESKKKTGIFGLLR